MDRMVTTPHFSEFTTPHFSYNSTVRNSLHAGRAYKIRERIIAQKTILSFALGRP